MSRFNTNNPLDSGHLNDFEDNVKNLDQAVNSVEETWVDRFGRNRLSMFGSEENAKAILNKAKLSETRADNSASAAANSAASAAAVVTGGTASLSPEAGKIPLSDGEGKIDVNWLGADVVGLLAHLNDFYERIGNVEFELFIRRLFMGGEKGFWADPSDTSTLFQNADGTIAVVDGDPIGLVLDKTGNNYNLTQTVSASRPKLLNGGIAFDKVDDSLELEVPAGGITGTLFLATTRGTASYGVSMPEGVWTLGSAFNPPGDVVSAVLVDRVLTENEKARLHVFGVGKGGTEFGVETTFANAYRGWTHLVDFPLIDTGSGTSFFYAWYGCSGLTSFPVLDVSGGTDFSAAWYGCRGLTSFPALDVSSGTNFYVAWSGCSGLTSFPVLDVSSGTNFNQAWSGCSGLTSFPVLDVSSGTNFHRTWDGCRGLTSFPANFFDNCLATNFTSAFNNTNLSEASIDGILVSINSNATSNGTFNQSGGNAPSVVGQAAIDAMRSRGWTVTTTGGY